MRKTFGYLMVTASLIGFAGTAAASYTYSNGSTTVTGGNTVNADYQANSSYAQRAQGSQATPQVMPQAAGNAPSSYAQPAMAEPQASGAGATGQPVYTNGYTGPSMLDSQIADGTINPATGLINEHAPIQPAPAMTMAPQQPGVISDPQTIRNCLCLETQYERLQNDISAKQAAYGQAASQRAQLDSQLAADRAAGAASAAQARATSQQRIQLQNQINLQLIPAVQQATQRYNAAVASFQQSCGGKSYDTEVLGRVKTGLACQGG